MSKNFCYCTLDDFFSIVFHVWSWKMLRKVVA